MNGPHNRLLFALFISFWILNILHAQDVSTIWLKVSDDFASSDSIILIFANTPEGTYNKDSVSPFYQEYEDPPGNPSLDALWVQIAPNKPGDYGVGFPMLDVRGIPQNPTQKDTFVVQITHGNPDARLVNFTVRWPCVSYLSQRCDSMFISDGIGSLTDTTGKPIGTINMFEKNSITILAPLQTFPIFKLKIHKYGVYLVDNLNPPCCNFPNGNILPGYNNCILDVVYQEHQLPLSSTLYQNYPNPFNPITRIQYSLAGRVFVNVKIMNVLGEIVTTLVNEIQNAGEQSVTWDASNVPSGIYFYRLQAGNFVEVKKMIVMK